MTVKYSLAYVKVKLTSIVSDPEKKLQICFSHKLIIWRLFGMGDILFWFTHGIQTVALICNEPR